MDIKSLRMEAVTGQFGMQARYLPAESGKVCEEDGKAFGHLLNTLPGTLLAYCLTGMYSTTMWALLQAGIKPLPPVLVDSNKIGETKPSTLSRYPKVRLLPPTYWEAILEGRKWMAQPQMVG